MAQKKTKAHAIMCAAYADLAKYARVDPWIGEVIPYELEEEILAAIDKYEHREEERKILAIMAAVAALLSEFDDMPIEEYHPANIHALRLYAIYKAGRRTRS